MNEEMKSKWVKALRSGQYKQARGRVKRDDSYCCIGVGALACGHEVRDFTVTGHAAEKLSLTEEQITNLVRMNDSEEKSFRQIAAYIQKNF